MPQGPQDNYCSLWFFFIFYLLSSSGFSRICKFMLYSFSTSIRSFDQNREGFIVVIHCIRALMLLLYVYIIYRLWLHHVNVVNTYSLISPIYQAVCDLIISLHLNTFLFSNWLCSLCNSKYIFKIWFNLMNWVQQVWTLGTFSPDSFPFALFFTCIVINTRTIIIFWSVNKDNNEKRQQKGKGESGRKRQWGLRRRCMAEIQKRENGKINFRFLVHCLYFPNLGFLTHYWRYY